MQKQFWREYPDAKRTFLSFGRDRVSGCNLYGIGIVTMHSRRLNFGRRWKRNRKKPLGDRQGVRTVCIAIPVSDRYGEFEKCVRDCVAATRDRRPCQCLMPFANAAVDIDKPEDKKLVESILARSQSAERLPARDQLTGVLQVGWKIDLAPFNGRRYRKPRPRSALARCPTAAWEPFG